MTVQSATRQPGEPWQWYVRFKSYYLPLGEGRTIEDAWRGWKLKQGTGKGTRASPHWHEMAKAWNWRERAEAYDLSQKQPQLPDAEAFRRALDRCLVDYLEALQPKQTHDARGVPISIDQQTRESFKAISTLLSAMRYAGGKMEVQV